MSRSLLVLFSLFFLSFSVFAQEKPHKAARPNIPGSFMIDFGFNQGVQKPENFSQAFLGSRTLNLYYQYPIRIGRSHFSFNPGIGASMERWKFKNNLVLRDTINNSRDEFYFAPAVKYYPGIHKPNDLNYVEIPIEVKKSMLIGNYVEVPLEFRFDTAPEDLGRSFNFALGGRIGYLFDSKMKVKYKEDGETKILKSKENLGLKQLRYGVYTRIGVGSFNIFGFYNLTPLFENGKGPDQTTMTHYTIGISINGF